MKIFCIGHAVYDITLPVDKFPKENTKKRVTDRMECAGGSSSNAAVFMFFRIYALPRNTSGGANRGNGKKL